jgi:hypothetical protein
VNGWRALVLLTRLTLYGWARRLVRMPLAWGFAAFVAAGVVAAVFARRLASSGEATMLQEMGPQVAATLLGVGALALMLMPVLGFLSAGRAPTQAILAGPVHSRAFVAWDGALGMAGCLLAAFVAFATLEGRDAPWTRLAVSGLVLSAFVASSALASDVLLMRAGTRVRWMATGIAALALFATVASLVAAGSDLRDVTAPFLDLVVLRDRSSRLAMGALGAASVALTAAALRWPPDLRDDLHARAELFGARLLTLAAGSTALNVLRPELRTAERTRRPTAIRVPWLGGLGPHLWLAIAHLRALRLPLAAAVAMLAVLAALSAAQPHDGFWWIVLVLAPVAMALGLRRPPQLLAWSRSWPQRPFVVVLARLGTRWVLACAALGVLLLASVALRLASPWEAAWFAIAASGWQLALIAANEIITTRGTAGAIPARDAIVLVLAAGALAMLAGSAGMAAIRATNMNDWGVLVVVAFLWVAGLLLSALAVRSFSRVAP